MTTFPCLRRKPRREGVRRFSLLLCLLSAMAPGLAGTAAAQSPQWWTNGVLAGTAITNDYAPANAGQLKNMAWHAYQAMQAQLPGGAGTGVSVRVLGLTPGGDFSPVNIGQLKFVAQPFYARLIDLGHADAYPWAGAATTNDYAPANIGQLKNLFSFEITTCPDADLDTDHDGLPDCWEVQNDLDPFDDGTVEVVNGPEGDKDGDGFDNALEFELGAPANNPAWNGEELAYRLTHVTAVIVTNARSITTNFVGMRVTVEDSWDCVPGGNHGIQDPEVTLAVPALLECGYYIDIAVEGLVEDVDADYDEVYVEAATSTHYFGSHDGIPDGDEETCQMVGEYAEYNNLIFANSTVKLRYNTVGYRWHSGAYAEIVDAANTGPYRVDISGDDAICVGETTALGASGGAGEPYSWSDGGNATVNSSGEVTGTSPGAATITATDANGCSAQYQIKVIKVDISQTNLMVCGEDPIASLSLTGDSYSPGGYVWSSSPDGISGSGPSNTLTFVPSNLPPGKYTVQAESVDLSDCYDVCEVNILKIELVPNYDRDSDIGSDDVARANTNEVFRFWVNDDDDFDVNTGVDVPDGSQADYNDAWVDNKRDFIDFFPVWLDLQETLGVCPSSDYDYILKNAGFGFNAVINLGLTPSEADHHLKNSTFCENNKQAPIKWVDSVGLTLPTGFLDEIENNNRGVILLEARKSTTLPLVLEIREKSNSTIIYTKEMPVSIDRVEKFYRHINLRPDGYGRATEIGVPANYPDALCSDKNVFFLHGFGTDGEGARGWHAEVFKRMYWAGSNAKFWGVTWEGDLGLVNGLNYQEDVANCFLVASNLYNQINNIPNKTVMAHSLGNMVVSAAIQDYGLSMDNYFMLNAAVAIEAYDQSEFDTSTTNPMVHEDWRGYSTSTWSATWHQLFTAPDHRAALTWENRFSSSLSNAYNFFSTGDEIFELVNGMPGAFFGGIFHLERYAWHKQEIFKGRLGMGSTDEAGWGFSGEYTQAEANGATPDNLRTNAVFRQEPIEMFSSNIDTQSQSKILGLGIPALSGAAGRNQINNLGNYDMEASKPSDYPSRGLPYNTHWLHSDLKNMAYLYTHQLFDELVSQGDLP